MAGNGYVEGMEYLPQGFLHIEGELGFHAPEIVANRMSYRPRDLIRMHDETIAMMARLLFLSDDNRIPISLLKKVVDTDPDEILSVQYIKEVIDWQIDIFGIEEEALRVFSDLDVRRAIVISCANWTRRFYGMDWIEKVGFVNNFKSETRLDKEGVYHVFVTPEYGTYGPEGTQSCTGTYRINEMGRIFVSSELVEWTTELPNEDYSSWVSPNPMWVLPPSTPLRDLAGLNGESLFEKYGAKIR